MASRIVVSLFFPVSEEVIGGLWRTCSTLNLGYCDEVIDKTACFSPETKDDLERKGGNLSRMKYGSRWKLPQIWGHSFINPRETALLFFKLLLFPP